MIKEKNELIKERVELEKGRTKNILYKFVDLLQKDVEYVFDGITCDREARGITKRIMGNLRIRNKDKASFRESVQSIVDSILWASVNGKGMHDVAKCILDSSEADEFEFMDDILFGITRKHIEKYMDDIMAGDKYGILWWYMLDPICERAARLGVCDKSEESEDRNKIRAAIEAFCMDVDALLDASDEDFSNEIIGILKNISDDYKETFRHVDYRIFNGFVPRFSRHNDLKYYTVKKSNKYGDKLIYVSVLNGTPESAIQAAILEEGICSRGADLHVVKEHSFEEFAKLCKDNDTLVIFKKGLQKRMAEIRAEKRKNGNDEQGN